MHIESLQAIITWFYFAGISVSTLVCALYICTAKGVFGRRLTSPHRSCGRAASVASFATLLASCGNKNELASCGSTLARLSSGSNQTLQLCTAVEAWQSAVAIRTHPKSSLSPQNQCSLRLSISILLTVWCFINLFNKLVQKKKSRCLGETSH